ncbi:MAG: RMD1 family protein [Bdellovibrionota bacterium]
MRKVEDREDFLVICQADQNVHVSFDSVSLPEARFEYIDIVALVVAESITMDHYDGVVEAQLEQSLRISESLQKKGRLPNSDRKMRMQLGSSMTAKQQLVHNLYLLDHPEVLWEDQRLDKLYFDMVNMFEIQERFRGLQYKLDGLQEDMSLVAFLSSNQRMERMELAIVFLIVMEIVLALFMPK